MRLNRLIIGILFALLLSFSPFQFSSRTFFESANVLASPNNMPPATDYYLIDFSGTGFIGTANDVNSFGTSCTLRDASEIASAGTLPPATVTGCDVTLVGVAPATPTYVINLPTGGYTYTLEPTISPTVFRQLQFDVNHIYVVGDMPANTIIQANLNPQVADYNVMEVRAGGRLELYNLTVRHGAGIGAFVINGGGINIGGQVSSTAHLLLDNVHVRDNWADQWGGGIYMHGSNSTLEIRNGSLIDGNMSDPANSGSGGGIYIQNAASITITDSTISNNIAREGGGLRTTTSAPIVIQNSLIDGNQTVTPASNGGGLWFGGSNTNVTLDNTTVSNNSVAGGAAQGGGIFMQSGGLLTIQNNSLIGGAGNPNSASQGGGIYINSFLGAQMIIDNSTVSFNTAVNGGGGIHNGNGLLTIRNNALIDNNTLISFAGAGIRTTGANAQTTITDSTISNNTGGFYGGGVYNQSGATTIITDSRVDNNSSSTGAGVANVGLDATTTLDNVVVVNNDAAGGGGGVANIDGGTLNIQNGSIIGSVAEPNTANGGGGIINSGIHENGGVSLARSTMTITNSFVQGNLANANVFSWGGGIFNDDRAQLTITNSQITDNQANGLAGGIYSNSDDINFYPDGSLILIDNSTLNNNIALNGDGGGLYHQDNGTITIQNGTTINNNSASRDGGGIFIDHFNIGQFVADIDILNGQILNNTAGGDGGGVYVGHGFNKTNDILFDNTPIGSVAQPNTAQSGGGIYHEASATNAVSTITLQNGANIIGNTASLDGGAIYSSSFFTGTGTINLDGVQITDNQAIGGSGGAIYNFSDSNAASNINLTNGAIVQNNQAGANGGAIYNDAVFTVGAAGGTSTILADDTLFTLNTASINGGVVFNTEGSGGTTNTTITNSFLLTNTATNGGGVYHDNGALTINNSCINNNDEGFRNITGIMQNATGNWWGSLDGPRDLDGLSGATGSGDGVTEFVDFSGFLTTSIDPTFCPAIAPIYDSTPLPSGTLVINTTLNVPATGDIMVTNIGGVALDLTAFTVGGATPELILLTTAPITLNPTESTTLTFECLSPMVGTFNETLTVDHTAINSPATYAITCNVTELPVDTGAPQLTITKQGNFEAGGVGLVGDTLIWTIMVSNTGSVPASNVVVSDSVSSHLQVSDATTTYGTVTINGQMIRVDIGTLDAGSSITIQIVTTLVSLPENSLLENTASVSGSGQSVSVTAVINVVTGLPDTGYPPQD